MNENPTTSINNNSINQGAQGNFNGDVIIIADGSSLEQNITLPILRQLPLPPADFVGHDAELDQAYRALTTGAAPAISVHGLPGVGKTTFALKLAALLDEHTPDGQLLVDLHGSRPSARTPAEAMAYVIRSLHPAAKIPADEASITALYRSVLHGKRLLLLLDDAAAAQGQQLLPPPRPADDHHESSALRPTRR